MTPNARPKQKIKGQSPLWALLRLLTLLALLAGLCAGTVILVKGYVLYRDAIAAQPLESRVADVLAQPDYTPLADLPPLYLTAVVAVEDCRFDSHHGVDPISIARAVWIDLTTWSLKEGGSTITQQLAKNLYFTQEKQFTRKIAEVFMAFALERQYEKTLILELYVNSIYFGSGYTGIYAASTGYFGVEPKDMTPAQSTLLAGVPQSPTAYSPTRHPEAAAKRQRAVIQRMLDLGYITQSMAQQLRAQTLA